jgi:hypothetical protein
MRKIVLTENQIKFVLDSMLEEQVGFEKQDNVNVIISTKDPRHSKFFSTKDLGYMVKRAGLRWNDKTKSVVPDKEMDNEFNQNVSKMKSMMDSASSQVFDSILTANPKFYYYCIYLFMNDQFGSQTKNKKIVVDNEKTIKQEMVAAGQEGKEVQVPIVEEGYEIFSPPQIQQPMQFTFNEAIMTPDFVQYINDNLLGPMDEGIQNMTAKLEKQGRTATDVYINKLQISSSCSTIPNGVSKRTFPNKVPTFKELSEARAKVVYDYLVKELTKRKAKFNQQGVSINSDGTNAGQSISIKNGNQTIQVDGTGSSGEPYNGQNKDGLIKYQRVEFIIEFAVRGTTPPQSKTVKVDPIPPQFAPVEKNDFIVRFTATGRNIFKFRPNLNINITLPSLRLGLFQKRGKGMACPRV